MFRKYLGGALLRSRNPDHSCLQPAPGKGHWERQGRRACDLCKPLEDEISRLLRGRFSFRCVAITDPDERDRLEELLIATLAHRGTCTPSPTWFGFAAYNANVRRSGLWNSTYTTSYLRMGAEDVARLEALISATPVYPAAPRGGPTSTPRVGVQPLDHDTGGTAAGAHLADGTVKM